METSEVYPWDRPASPLHGCTLARSHPCPVRCFKPLKATVTRRLRPSSGGEALARATRGAAPAGEVRLAHPPRPAQS